MIKKILCLSLILPSFSCAFFGPEKAFDRKTGLDHSGYKDLMLRKEKSEKGQNLEESKLQKNSSTKKPDPAPIPRVSKLIAIPPSPKIGSNKLVSFSVTDQVDIKDVLIEFGRVAKIDIDIDPTISGGIILNAKNRPIKEVIDRIATLARLRYSFENNVLHFEADSPYLKNYFVDYLIDGQLWTDVETNLSSILSAGISSSQSDEGGLAYYSSNKSAGIISVFATDRQQKMVSQYLDDVSKTASAQVLIEAKVIEVTLSDEFSSGIDWTSVGSQNNITTSGGYTEISAGSAITYVGSSLFGSDLSASVSALQTFGTARTISSPRLHAINNQKATLNFTDENVYFKIDSSTAVATATTASTSTTSAITSTKETVNTGSSLEITPSINLITNEITLNINPKLAILGTSVTDPASPTGTDSSGATVAISGLENQVPQTGSREISTIAKIQSGNIVVIGGLMSESTENTDSGIPILSSIPIIGWLFKSVSKTTSTVETVVFVKATIIKSGSLPKKFYRDLEKFDSSKNIFFGQ